MPLVRSWDVSELIQLGDSAYKAQSSTLLDYNIGTYYNTDCDFNELTVILSSSQLSALNHCKA